MGVLKCTPEQCLDFLQARMGRLMANQLCADEILAVDEASMCLRDDDRPDLHTEQSEDCGQSSREQ